MESYGKKIEQIFNKKNVQTSLYNQLFLLILFIHFPYTQKKPIEKPNSSFNPIDIFAYKCTCPGSYPADFLF